MGRPLLLISILLVIPCIGYTDVQEGESQHSFNITTENGIQIAENSEFPKYSGELFTYNEVLRLIQDEENPESLLSQPGIVLTDDAGNFYLDEVRGNRIVSFDASGNYIRNIGRQGEGPGEYRSASLECIHNDLLVVTDSMLNRIIFFRTDGTFVDSSPLPAHARMNIHRFRLGPDDERILLGDIQRVDEDENRYHMAMAKVFSSAGDAMASIASEDIHIAKDLRIQQYNTLDIIMRYFTTSPNVHYHPTHGLVMTDGLEPVMRCYDLQGHLQRMIRMNLPPDPVTNAERRAIRKYHRDQILDAEDEQSRITRQKRYEYVEFQDPKAYFTISRIDDYGYIWAARPYTGLSNDLFTREGDNACMLFNPEGEYLGDTVFPVRNTQLARGCLISVQDNLETGAKEVVIYSINPIASGFVYP